MIKAHDQQLLKHPLVQSVDLAVQRSEQDIALAKEDYKPQWGVEFKYGREQGNMSTMASANSRDKFSAMVMLDIPLFAGNRQDRQLSASQYQHEANSAQRLETLRQLRGQLRTEWVCYEGYKNREALFQKQLMPQVISQSEVSLTAYQSDASDFADVIQAYKTRLEISLEYTQLQADTLQSKTRLRYLLPSDNDLQVSLQHKTKKTAL